MKQLMRHLYLYTHFQFRRYLHITVVSLRWLEGGCSDDFADRDIWYSVIRSQLWLFRYPYHNVFSVDKGGYCCGNRGSVVEAVHKGKLMMISLIGTFEYSTLIRFQPWWYLNKQFFIQVYNSILVTNLWAPNNSTFRWVVVMSCADRDIWILSDNLSALILFPNFVICSCTNDASLFQVYVG